MWLEKFLSADGNFKESARRTKEFKKEIFRKAKDLAEKFGIATDLLSHVLEEAAELSPSPNEHGRLVKIIESGFKSGDLIYSPIEETIEHLGPKQASRVFKLQFGKLLKAWSFAQKTTPQGKVLQTMWPPFFLTKKEWVAYHVQYHDFLTGEKSVLIADGRSKELPEISFLLRVLPLTLLDDDRRLIDCGSLEVKGLSIDELRKEFSKSGVDTEAKNDEDIIEYREKIHSLYLSAYKDLPKNLNLDNFERLAFEIAKTIRGEFTLGELEGLKEIESRSPVFNFVERIEAPELPDSIIKFALAFLLPAFEAKNSSDLRAKLSHLIRFTSFGFPIIEVNLWSELKRRTDEHLDVLSLAEDSFSESRRFTFAFIKKVSAYVFADEVAHEKNLTDFVDTNSHYISEVISEIDGEASTENNIVEIKGTQYIFKNGFRELHWKHHSWRFKNWERHIVRAFFEAYMNKSKGFLDSDEIHELAMRFRFKSLEGEKKEKDQATAQNKHKTKKRYMFTDVFKAHPLNGKFFVAKEFSNKKKSRLYTINPGYDPNDDIKEKTKSSKNSKPHKTEPKKSRPK